jgi:hypothetical protein
MPGQQREARLSRRRAGHPRPEEFSIEKDIDGRNKSGHDDWFSLGP